jgi:S1-C subfamily serine protease
MLRKIKVSMEKYKIIFLSIVIVSSFFLFSYCSTYKPFQPPAEWETYKMSQVEIEKYLKANYQTNHFIEGVWQVSANFTMYSTVINEQQSGSNANMFNIAIIRENINNPNENKYVIVIVSSGPKDWNFPGRIKGRLTRINSNTYSINWYNMYYHLVQSNFHFNTYGELYGNFQYTEDKINISEDYTFSKVYPQNEIIPDNEKEVNNNVESTGSGILLSKNGIIITNHHIVEDANIISVEIPTNNIIKYAKVILSDKNNDVAVLELIDFQYDSIYSQNLPFTFADIKKTKLGQNVFTVGYPLGELLGNTPRVSNGIINSLFGVQDDPRLLQISNPLQPGNSGSPLFNEDGEILGLVVASLDAKYFYDNLGIIPQNVNFAIKNTFIKNLLEILPNSNILNNKNSLTGLSLEKQLDKIGPYIIKIKAYKKTQ